MYKSLFTLLISIFSLSSMALDIECTVSVNKIYSDDVVVEKQVVELSTLVSASGKYKSHVEMVFDDVLIDLNYDVSLNDFSKVGKYGMGRSILDGSLLAVAGDAAGNGKGGRGILLGSASVEKEQKRRNKITKLKIKNIMALNLISSRSSSELREITNSIKLFKKSVEKNILREGVVESALLECLTL